MLAFYTTKYECATLPMCDLNNSLEFDCASFIVLCFCTTSVQLLMDNASLTAKSPNIQENKSTKKNRTPLQLGTLTLLLPLQLFTRREYLIYDAVGLIGSIGGTLGIFIGFSFSNTISNFVHYIQILFAKVVLKFSSNSFE